MPKGDQYIELTNYLSNLEGDSVELTFGEIENILGFQLPLSAKNHTAWWSNTTSHSQAYGWMNANYKTEKLDEILETKKVKFIKH